RLARVRLERQEPRRAARLLRAEIHRYRKDAASFTIEDLRDFGVLMLDAGMARPAAAVFADLRRRTPEDAHASHHFAVACFESKMHRIGAKASRRAVRLDPGLMPAWHNLALSAMTDGRWGRAKLCLRKAQQIAPKDAAVRRLALAYRVKRLLAVLRW